MTLVGVGAVVPEALGAAETLAVYGEARGRRLPDLPRPPLSRVPGAAGLLDCDDAILDELFPSRPRARRS